MLLSEISLTTQYFVMFVVSKSFCAILQMFTSNFEKECILASVQMLLGNITHTTKLLRNRPSRANASPQLPHIQTWLKYGNWFGPRRLHLPTYSRIKQVVVMLMLISLQQLRGSVRAKRPPSGPRLNSAQVAHWWALAGLPPSTPPHPKSPWKRILLRTGKADSKL